MDSKITISGQIIKELSEKIPSNIVALNELIKNSYDAGANKVTINLDSETKLLTIEDDGEGMTKRDIDILLHIAQSEKQYGVINKFNRYTQGSKGLGFLSVFKFGSVVRWNTKSNKEQGYKFSIDYNDLLKCYNVSEYNVAIQKTNKNIKGTIIEIEVEDYSLTFLKDYLSEEKNSSKILNSFNDNKFQIKLVIDSIEQTSQQLLDISSIHKEAQIFQVFYNSNEEKIIYKNGNKILHEVDFSFDSNNYKINIELAVYKLKPKGTQKIDELFHRPDDEITPLIYINNNFFNNYDLFNPDIMRKVQSSKSLSQMVGKINIYSDSTMLDFNSDRTQFIQNKFTDGIRDFLFKINTKIQEEGSEYYSKNIKGKNRKTSSNNVDNKKKTETKEEPSGESNIEPNDTVNKWIKLTAAYILLKNYSKTIEVPSNQLNLYNNIDKAKNSMGKDIEEKDIQITSSNLDVKITNGILESITLPKRVEIIYSYSDLNTGKVEKKYTINFTEKRYKLEGISCAENIISIPIKEGYCLSYDNRISNLIGQINSLNMDEYKEVIACSLRAIFDISVKVLNRSSKYQGEFRSGLNNDVAKVISFCKRNEIMTKIDKSTGLGFHHLNNVLNITNFESALDVANLGAHFASDAITEDEIKGLAKKAGYFAVIVNEMLNNSNIKW